MNSLNTFLRRGLALSSRALVGSNKLVCNGSIYRTVYSGETDTVELELSSFVGTGRRMTLSVYTEDIENHGPIKPKQDTVEFRGTVWKVSSVDKGDSVYRIALTDPAARSIS